MKTALQTVLQLILSPLGFFDDGSAEVSADPGL